MRNRLLASGAGLTVAALGLCALTGCGPQSNEGAGYVRLGAQNQPAPGGTNLLASRNDALKRLEDDLTKSFDIFAPKSSVDAIPAPHLPPPRPVVPNRAALEEQRRRSWLLTDPDEFGKPQGLRDFLESPFDKERQRDKTFGSGADSIFDRLNNKSFSPDDTRRNTDDRTGMAKQGPNKNIFNQDEDADLPGGVKESVQSLRKLLGTDNTDARTAAAEPRASLSDIFGLNSHTLSEKEIEDHKAYMDAYREVLAGADSVKTINPVNLSGAVLGPSTPAGSTYAPGLDSYTTSGVLNRNPYGAASPPALAAPNLPDVNARVLNQWNPLYTPPTTVEPPRAAPPKPNFDAPRRKF